MLEIKIVFKNGLVGFYTQTTDEEPTEENMHKLRDFIGNAIKDDLRGSFELMEIGTRFLTVIDIEEIATFGTRVMREGIENE